MLHEHVYEGENYHYIFIKSGKPKILLHHNKIDSVNSCFYMYSNENCHNVILEEVRRSLNSTVSNLSLDSQVIISIHTELDCDKVVIHEAYKV